MSSGSDFCLWSDALCFCLDITLRKLGMECARLTLFIRCNSALVKCIYSDCLLVDLDMDFLVHAVFCPSVTCTVGWVFEANYLSIAIPTIRLVLCNCACVCVEYVWLYSHKLCWCCFYLLFIMYNFLVIFYTMIFIGYKYLKDTLYSMYIFYMICLYCSAVWATG